MERAATIIDLLGGTKEVARIARRGQSSVVKWRLPRETGGTAGHIPAACLFALYSFALQNRLPVSLDVFLFTPEQRRLLCRIATISSVENAIASSRKTGKNCGVGS